MKSKDEPLYSYADIAGFLRKSVAVFLILFSFAGFAVSARAVQARRLDEMDPVLDSVPAPAAQRPSLRLANPETLSPAEMVRGVESLVSVILSVRTRPVCEELFSKAYEIYDDARATEDQAKADGADRRQAAEQGAARILDLLDKAGLPDYEAFQNTALPAEVAGREELSAGLPSQPNADGPMTQMLRSREIGRASCRERV